MEPVRLPDEMRRDLWEKIQNVDVGTLMRFQSWQDADEKRSQKGRGLDLEVLMEKRKLGVQRRAAGVGLTPTSIPRGLRKAVQHTMWAMSLEHPLREVPPLEMDLEWAAEGHALRGPAFRQVVGEELRGAAQHIQSRLECRCMAA